jgi:SAM-dependent methyltransferase
MIAIEAREAYRLWAPSYDSTPNPLLALESRVVARRLPIVQRQTVIDVATGTGRWAAFAAALGARVIRVDFCRDMLMQSSCGDRVQADMLALPFRDGFADLAICSLALGYILSPAAALREMARVARRVVMSDLHPDAVRQGWTRSFRAGADAVQIRSYVHSMEDFEAAGLVREWMVEARFGPEEFAVFTAAGREDLYAKASAVNALVAMSWVQP